ncbi:MAG: hypothetical protein ACMXYC_02665 [Candidatus Woesearchaeota archaeon]
MRTQTEILGLVMVVLLISVGMLFVISFMVLRDSPQLQTAYIDEKTAEYFTSALLEATSDCREIGYRRLITDCVERSSGSRIRCDDGNFAHDSCVHLNDSIRRYLHTLLGDKGYQYHFRVVSQQQTPISMEMGVGSNTNFNCRQRNVQYSERVLLPNAGNIRVILQICR